MVLRHGKEYFSPSQLKKLYVSVSSLVSYLNKTWESTDAMDLGTAVHSALLEPDKFESDYYVLDDSDVQKRIGGARPTSTAKYRRWKKFVSHLMRDKTQISIENMEKIKKIKSNCNKLGISETYFEDGDAEVVSKAGVFQYAEEFNALCIVDYDTPFISVDLKTTSKPLDKFKYDADSLGYDIQASLTNAINGKEFVFIVVQTVEPFDVGVFTCSDNFMNRGKQKINKALHNYAYYNGNESIQLFEYEL